ncbi:MAG: DUF938 domain-containing protein [Pseudohongiellaceae bacterium]
MTASLPFSQASENNKRPILDILKRHLSGKSRLLEIGGGTGQHAVFFAEQFPGLIWQSSDVADNVASLNQRIAASALPNLPSAIALDVNDPPQLTGAEGSLASPRAGHPASANYEAVFSANSLHIMSMDSVVNFFSTVGGCLGAGGLLLVYGPFKYGGEFTTDSNAQFDIWLKQRDPVSGVRDFERVNALAVAEGLSLAEDNAMPANNQLLVWRR